MTDQLVDQMEIDRITIAADHLAPLIDLQRVTAVTAMGLNGDRHFGNPARQVTIQSRTELDLAAERLGRPIETDLTRRNITLREGLLPRTRGCRISLGEVVLEVFADAAPCKLMDELHGPGAKIALKRLAGIHCRVIEGGSMAVGDLFLPVATQDELSSRT